MSDFYDIAYNNPYHINRHDLIESYYKKLNKNNKFINNFYNINNNKNKKNKNLKISKSYDYFNLSIKNNESDDSSLKIKFLINKKENEKNNSIKYFDVNDNYKKFFNIKNNNKINLFQKPIGNDINNNIYYNFYKLKKLNNNNNYNSKNNDFSFNNKYLLNDIFDYKKKSYNDKLNNIILKNFQTKLKKFDTLKLYIKNSNYLEDNAKKNEILELNKNNYDNDLKKFKDEKMNSILNNFFNYNFSKNKNNNSNIKLFYSANTTNQKFFCNKLLNNHSFNSTKSSKNYFNSTKSIKKFDYNTNKNNNNLSKFHNSSKNDNSLFFNENNSNNHSSEKINLLIPPYTGYEIDGEVAIPKRKKLKIKRFFLSKELKEKMRCWKMENLKDFGYDAEFIEGMIYSPEDQKKIDELNKKNKENNINDNEKKKGTITIRMGDNNYNKVEEEDEEVEYEEIEEEENENNN